MNTMKMVYIHRAARWRDGGIELNQPPMAYMGRGGATKRSVLIS